MRMIRRLRGRDLLFGAGLVAIAASVVPPVESLAEESFAGHMGQHLLIFLAAPLLLVAGDLDGRVRRSLPRRVAARAARAERAVSSRPWVVLGGALALHALAIGAWHVPALYDAALEHGIVHASEHAVLFWGGLAFWWAVVVGARRAEGVAVVAVFVGALQTGSLGALLAFAPRLLYSAYGGTAPGGLTPLEDQALGGVVMWTVGGAVYVAAGAWLFARWLREEERRVALLESIARPADASRVDERSPA